MRLTLAFVCVATAAAADSCIIQGNTGLYWGSIDQPRPVKSAALDFMRHDPAF